MKFLNRYALTALFVMMLSCNSSNESQTVIDNSESEVADVESKDPEGYKSYGEVISPEFPLRLINMDNLEDLKVGDSLQMKVVAEVNEVCQAKGCWMKLKMARGEEMMVKFKDYGFFVPKDIAGKEVVISGKAYVEEMSVEDQRHYAEDEGKPESVIAAIKEPKKTLSFLADGVLVEAE